MNLHTKQTDLFHSISLLYQPTAECGIPINSKDTIIRGQYQLISNVDQTTSYETFLILFHNL
jgi:hypothetical protein